MSTAVTGCVLPVPENSHFPVQNLPFGVFRHRTAGTAARIGVAVGSNVIDMSRMAEDGCFAACDAVSENQCFSQDSLNAFMALGRPAWRQVRSTLQAILTDATGPLCSSEFQAQAVVPMEEVEMLLPARIGDYTDFYASKEHATTVGAMFRDPQNALHPNWTSLPVAYHGRASSVVASGTPVRRPRGQVLSGDGTPVHQPSAVVDFELEMAALIGPGNEWGAPVSIEQAEEHIFGLVLMNDWSARDVQKWEYVPLGPFNSKNWDWLRSMRYWQHLTQATSISPWVVTLDALEPFRCAAPEQEPAVLPYLQEISRSSYNIQLQATLQPSGCSQPSTVATSNFRHLYWTLPQMIAHHTVGGCNLRTGDLLGSGTISCQSEDGSGCGCLLERTGGGKEAVQLEGGQERVFLQDGDTVTLSGFCQGDGYRVGFGACSGTLLPAL